MEWWLEGFEGWDTLSEEYWEDVDEYV
jgi:hypothetical protein